MTGPMFTARPNPAPGLQCGRRFLRLWRSPASSLTAFPASRVLDCSDRNAFEKQLSAHQRGPRVAWRLNYILNRSKPDLGCSLQLRMLPESRKTPRNRIQAEDGDGDNSSPRSCPANVFFPDSISYLRARPLPMIEGVNITQITLGGCLDLREGRNGRQGRGGEWSLVGRRYIVSGAGGRAAEIFATLKGREGGSFGARRHSRVLEDGAGGVEFTGSRCVVSKLDGHAAQKEFWKLTEQNQEKSDQNLASTHLISLQMAQTRDEQSNHPGPRSGDWRDFDGLDGREMTHLRDGNVPCRRAAGWSSFARCSKIELHMLRDGMCRSRDVDMSYGVMGAGSSGRSRDLQNMSSECFCGRILVADSALVVRRRIWSRQLEDTRVAGSGIHRREGGNLPFISQLTEIVEACGLAGCGLRHSLCEPSKERRLRNTNYFDVVPKRVRKKVFHRGKQLETPNVLRAEPSWRVQSALV
ncbi:hypothetical protein DFH09DRAFT_1109973 [Mycena vulgaris]|nr:hypothetical protein DFH09DRAFT_1109973 [Mycena vulgaris]